MSLTIKQAFEALSDACANGMKNPFFVMRRLKESFADVASKVDAGGSEVSVTPITDSGTKIATITVDSVDKDIYAPKAEVTQTVQSGTEIAEIDGTKIYIPASGNDWTYFATKTGQQESTLPTNWKEVLIFTCVGSGTDIAFYTNHAVRDFWSRISNNPFITSGFYTMGDYYGGAQYVYFKDTRVLKLNNAYYRNNAATSNATTVIYYK